jgi:hypothetical protein
VNALLNDYHARVYIDEASDSLIYFYEQHRNDIKGELVIVRSEEDVAHAAYIRNHSDKALFVFSERYWITSYFSGTCQKVKLSKALIHRIGR